MIVTLFKILPQHTKGKKKATSAPLVEQVMAGVGSTVELLAQQSKVDERFKLQSERTVVLGDHVAGCHPCRHLTGKQCRRWVPENECPAGCTEPACRAAWSITSKNHDTSC